ncbi:hypothetical protein ADK38_02165 [Streptomyces varsoviensis]|uniref:DUF3995 domain-containing protein n=3 Tax=Streptomyces varsoviensis TaxID=67373 RepID=A0ABR5JDW2_9ACTN|nr:hypothetical protein ADK38_02165 [Streptomyces varsoviensis]
MRQDLRDKTESGARGSVAGVSGSAGGMWGWIACGWAVAFAGLHFFWGLGGSWGLSVSAGPLADERPLWFVVVGLWGVGALCLVGGVLGRLLAGRRRPGPVGRVLAFLGWCVSAVLLGRGLAVEVLLLTGDSGPGPGVSSAQRLWTLLLWNPWFLLGGLIFGLAAWEFGKARGGSRGSAP